MTLILDLPPGVEATLARETAQQGTTPERLAVDGLRQLVPEAGDMPKTGADLLAIWEAEGAFLPAERREDHQRRARQVRTEAWRRE